MKVYILNGLGYYSGAIKGVYISLKLAQKYKKQYDKGKGFCEYEIVEREVLE